MTDTEHLNQQWQNTHSSQAPSGEPLCTVGRNVNQYSYGGKQYGDSSKNKKQTNIELPYNSVIPLLCVFKIIEGIVSKRYFHTPVLHSFFFFNLNTGKIDFLKLFPQYNFSTVSMVTQLHIYVHILFSHLIMQFYLQLLKSKSDRAVQ